jgi:hypothetical protein
MSKHWPDSAPFWCDKRVVVAFVPSAGARCDSAFLAYPFSR